MHTTASTMNTYAFEWELDSLLGVRNSAIQQISNWIQMAGTYRSTVVLDKVHMAFFNSDCFTEMTTRANEHF